MVGTVVINDQHQLFHVEAARRHAGGHQQLHLTGLEVHDRGVPVELINTCNRWYYYICRFLIRMGVSAYCPILFLNKD